MSTKEVLRLLDELEAFKLGNFTLKTGVQSPIYIDLRVMIDSPEVYMETAKMFCAKIKEANLQYDKVAGAPYGAVPMASWVSWGLKKPLLFVRQKAKAHGTKKLIDGRYEAGQKVLIIEDVVTSGSSVLDTVEELRKANLTCTDVVCQLDRQQGGAERLKEHGINLISLMTMDSILDYLVDSKKLSREGRQEVVDALSATTASIPAALRASSESSSWSLAARRNHLKHPLNQRLVDIIIEKKTNLCVAVDLPNADDVLRAIDSAKDHVCAFKIHYDIIDDFTVDFANRLLQLAQQHNFVLFEDRKFADADEITRRQLVGGPVQVAQWADIVTQHAIAGPKSIEALRKVIGQSKARLAGCLLVAEMSTKGTLTKPQYISDVVEMAEEYRDVVCGFICQRRCSSDPGYLYWTPGVHEGKKSEGGQQWRTVERAIVDEGNDIVIVGRGITQAADAAAEAAKYAKLAWDALQKRDA